MSISAITHPAAALNNIPNSDDASPITQVASSTLSQQISLETVQLPNAKVLFPGASWESWGESEDSGFSPDSLKKTINLVSRMDTSGFMVVKNGKMLCSSGDLRELSYVASIRKSINAMLMGKYVEACVIDINATLESLDFDDIHGLTPLERQAKIIDLIAARSCIYHPASNPGDDSSSAPPRSSKTPGSHFLYNNWDFNAAEALFENLTKTSLYAALEQNLAIPIEMEDFNREAQKMSGDTTKSKYLAHHMWLSTRDMARLGYLMLHKGNWNGTRIIPEQWVDKIVSVVTPYEEMGVRKTQDGGLFEFGLMWWIWRDDPTRLWLKGAYTAAGSFGQYISVFPVSGVVVAHKVSGRITKPRSWLQEPAPNVSMREYMRILDTLFN